MTIQLDPPVAAAASGRGATGAVPYSRNEPSGNAASGSDSFVICTLAPAASSATEQSRPGVHAPKKLLSSTSRPSGRPPISSELSTR